MSFLAVIAACHNVRRRSTQTDVGTYVLRPELAVLFLELPILPAEPLLERLVIRSLALRLADLLLEAPLRVQVD